MNAVLSQTLFPLGCISITPIALEVLNTADTEAAIRRHASGDWGELCQKDIDANTRALQPGQHERRLFSAYLGQGGTRFWIITSADRSSTTIFLPEEYGALCF